MAYETLDALGDLHNKRHLVPRVIQRWSDGVQGYSHLLALHASSLVDVGAFDEAEDLGMRSLALDSSSRIALAAVASAMIAQNRPREAVRLLREFRDSWQDEDATNPSGTLTRAQQKLGWLWALAEIEQGQYENALRRFHDFGRTKSTLREVDAGNLRRPSWPLVDAVSLLHRLRMCGMDVDEPWSELVDRYADVTTAGSGDRAALFDVHLSLLIPDAVRNTRENMTTPTEELCDAMRMSTSNPVKAEERLRPLRFKLEEAMGGSFLHRDLIHWIALDCSIRGKSYAWGQALASERISRHPAHAHAWRMYAEILHGIGNVPDADSAYIRALDLGLGQGGSHAH